MVFLMVFEPPSFRVFIGFEGFLAEKYTVCAHRNPPTPPKIQAE